MRRDDTVRTRRARLALWGAAAASLYLAVAVLSFRWGLAPVRPLYDGPHVPTGYRWVNPPPDAAGGNTPPGRGGGTMRLGPRGSAASAFATEDAQGIVSFQEGSVRPREGQRAIRVSIEQIDAATLGPSPERLRFDGNGYRISAAYVPSGDPAEMAADACPPQAQPKLCPTLVLRYAVHATALHRWDGTAWREVAATNAPAALQLFADTPELGTFVPVGPPLGRTGGGSGNVLAIVIAAVAVAGAILSRQKPVRRWWRRLRKRRRSTGRPAVPRR